LLSIDGVSTNWERAGNYRDTHAGGSSLCAVSCSGHKSLMQRGNQKYGGAYCLIWWASLRNRLRRTPLTKNLKMMASPALTLYELLRPGSIRPLQRCRLIAKSRGLVPTDHEDDPAHEISR